MLTGRFSTNRPESSKVVSAIVSVIFQKKRAQNELSLEINELQVDVSDLNGLFANRKVGKRRETGLFAHFSARNFGEHNVPKNQTSRVALTNITCGVGKLNPSSLQIRRFSDRFSSLSEVCKNSKKKAAARNQLLFDKRNFRNICATSIKPDTTISAPASFNILSSRGPVLAAMVKMPAPFAA